MVEVIPVLDIRDGIAVSGRSGDRNNYGPLKSVFSNSPDPIEISQNLPFERLYIADLNGIVHKNPDISLLKKISAFKNTIIDLGVRNTNDLKVFTELECKIILGSETIGSETVLDNALELFKERIILSIDIKDRRVLSAFLPDDPLKAYEKISAKGIKEIIFLDISSVGTMKSDYNFIKNLNRTGKIILGGGITKKDLITLEKISVDSILIGTALHKGEWM